MFQKMGQPLTSPDTGFASYGEWLLLNGKTSPDDLESICREYFPFTNDLSLILLDNQEISRRCSLEALASALHASRRFPGGAVLAWLARFALRACWGRQPRPIRSYLWPAPLDPQENVLWGLLSSMDSDIQLLAVLHYRYELPVEDIARVCCLPPWRVKNNLILIRDLCQRHLQWANMPAAAEKIEPAIARTLAHQLPGTFTDSDQPPQLARELALALARKQSRQHRLVILQQAVLLVTLLAVLAYLVIK